MTDSDFLPPTYIQGQQRLKAGQHEAAREQFKLVLIQHPQFEPALYAMAWSYFKGWNNDRQEAKIYIKKAIVVVPEKAENYCLLGRIWQEEAYDEEDEKLLEKALEQLKKAIEIKPNHANYHAYLASIYLDKYDYIKCLYALKRAFTIESQNKLALDIKDSYDHRWIACRKRHGEEAFKQGNYEKAAYHYKRAISKIHLLEQPDDWLLKHKFLDAELGKIPFFRYSCIKWRTANSVSYATIVFHLNLLMFASFNSGYIDYWFYEPIQWLLGILGLRSLVYWISKPIGYYWIKRKIWGIKDVEIFNFHFLINGSMILGLISFFMYLFTHDFFWFSTAGVSMTCALYSGFGLVIRTSLKKTMFKIGLSVIYISGIIQFLSELTGFGEIDLLPYVILLGIMAIPFIAFIWTELEDKFN